MAFGNVADTESPSQISREPASFMGTFPLYSPSSDRRFWRFLRIRIDSILQDRNNKVLNGSKQENKGESNRAKRLKEDSPLLLRGFVSVAHNLSQLSNNLDNAPSGGVSLLFSQILKQRHMQYRGMKSLKGDYTKPRNSYELSLEDE